MSLKDRFANHSDTPAEQPQPEEQKLVELYDTPGHARNICFVQADGSMTFLNYAYLVSGEIDPDKKRLTVSFTTHVVRIEGECLLTIYMNIFTQSIKIIFTIEERYRQLLSGSDIMVKNISVTPVVN